MSKKKNRESSAFGQKLRELRKKRRITMKHLADQLDVSESYISRLETGERHPDKELIIKLGPLLFPEGNESELDALLIAADYTPLKLDQMTGRDDVIHHFQQVLEDDPRNFRAFNALIISLIKQGKYEVAKHKIQEGLKRYDASIHLQVLLGALELAQRNFDQALSYQQDALRAFDQNPDWAKGLYLQRSDLLLNLAVIHFLKGYDGVDAFLQDPQPALYDAARNNLMLASDSLKEALTQDPEDIYVLDERARVLFNLAYLDESAGKPVSYGEVVAAFEQVITSDEKSQLNYSELIESGLFLVHAYAKNRDFGAAERHINIIECCLPNYWLVHYIKACLYNRRYTHDQESRWMEKALRSLERALAIPDLGNRARHEAPHDPDLQAVRAYDPERFKKLLKLEGKP
ncbi:MAG TPA: helix-turn-helix domain-containing protein [Candidatus Obscuribacterales bacterium]